jgi:drug/metabolite transporter (DMT)-like permease
MSIPYGELAALGTAVCWTCSSLAFSAAGRRLGSLSLNLVRLVIAFAYLSLYCRVRRGMWLPLDADGPTWGWLLGSGLVGFVLGDLCLFRAFVLIGPRISMLIMALSPLITAFFGWLWLREHIGGMGALGMALTLLGVGWVVMERRPEQGSAEASMPRSEFMKGALLALLGAAGQAIGLVLSKLGMKAYDPFASTQIRIIAGMLGFAAIFTAVRWWGRTREGLRDRKGVGLAALGAFAGPFLGVSLSLLSIQHTETGIAATIMAMVPVLIIPAVVLLHREKVSLRAVTGAVVAVGGVALLWAR